VKRLISGLLISLNLAALEIRKPTINEIKDIADVYYKSWHHTFDSIAPHLSQVRTPENCLKKWQQYYRKSNTHFILVGLIDKKIVGILFAGPLETKLIGINNDYDSEIDKLYVLPEFKNRGIGSVLFKEACNKLREYGFKGTIVQSLTKNKEANNFYQKKGGSLIKQHPANFNETLDIYGFKLS